MNVSSNKNQKSSSKSSQAEIDKINEEMKNKIPNYYIATNSELGFKSAEAKISFDCFFKEYMDDTIRFLTVFSIHFNALDGNLFKVDF